MNLDLDIKFDDYSISGSLTGPYIGKSKNSLAFALTAVGDKSASQSFNVFGINLTAPLVLTAPAGFIINLDNSNIDASPMSINPVGGKVSTKKIYIKFAPAAAILYNANLTISTAGATTRTVLLNGLAFTDYAPVYTPAGIVLSQSGLPEGEVGEYYADVLTATFQQHDAGAASFIKIKKDGVDLAPTGTGNSLIITDNGYYTVAAQVFEALVNYGAGTLKNYSPSGKVDARAALVRNVNAPQAAENNFTSAQMTKQGFYKIFFGASQVDPAVNNKVRFLNGALESSGMVVNFMTGIVHSFFTVAMRATFTLLNVIDLTTANNITSNFVLTTMNVNDAAGNAVSYNVYVWNKSTPFSTDHLIQATIV